jgi:hypothetical protein
MVDRLPEQTSDFLLPFSNLSLQLEPTTVMDNPSSTADPTLIPIDPALEDSEFASSFPLDDQSASAISNQAPASSSAMAGGGSGHHQPSNTTANQFFCDWIDPDTNVPCEGIFPRECDLTKHYRNHSKPVYCLSAGCTNHFAENKDMHRHMWAHHPMEAEQLHLPGGARIHCPEVSCVYKTNRTDNLKRHCEKMHPGLLEES